MAIPTPSASSRPLAPAIFLGALTLLAGGCSEPPPPSLTAALAVRGSAPVRARAFVSVALAGPPAERRRAAFLWGLSACDADAPLSAVTAFRIARPSGGRAVLAARRLAAALERTQATGQTWKTAADSPWLAVRERGELLVAGGEALLRQGRTTEAAQLGRCATALAGASGGRALLVLARCGDTAALRELVLVAPALAEGQRELPSLAAVTASFTAAEWRRHAEAWLAAGDPRRALAAARRGGAAAAGEAAQAALRLRRPQEALRWARQLSKDGATRFLLEAEAYRQLAWGASGAARQRHFEACVEQARRARGAAEEAAERGAAAVLAAEGLVETGRFREAATYLRQEEAPAQPRFEWVWRRWVFLQAQRGGTLVDRELQEAGRTNRGRRLARYFVAAPQGTVREPSVLRELATSGFVDLPALWAARRLGEPMPVLVFDTEAPWPAPPLWSRDLVHAGRLADVLVGWRADLEAGRAAARGWLGLVAMARVSSLEAIPLLVRGEPRLLTGQWQGLPRSLLESYLPLPWREELERAAARSAVPPWLLAGLVRQESAWSPRAVSAAGAVGLAQVLPATAREVLQRQRNGLAVSSDITSPETNMTVGGMLLSRWRQSLGGSWVVALAAYNAGERRVRAVWEQAGRRDGAEFVEALEIPETWDYVHRVVMLAEGYRALYWPAGKEFPWM